MRSEDKSASAGRWASLLRALLASFAGMWLFAGCASQRGGPPPAFYPPSPAPPRVQYLRSYSGSDDLHTRDAFLTFLIGKPAPDRIGKPYGLAMWDSKIYVCDTQLNAIRVFDLKKQRIGMFAPSGGGALKKPLNISIDHDGTTYVADTVRGQVIIYRSNGECLAVIGGPKEMKPVDVALSSDRFMVSDMKNHQVKVFDKTTHALLFAVPREPQNDSEKLFAPANVAVGPDGSIYVSDMGAFRVQKYDAMGKYLVTLGRHGDMPGEFARPKGVAVSKSGYVFAVDAAAQSVQVFDQAGKLLMFFGEVGGSQYPLNLPAKVIIDYEHVELFREYVSDDFEVEFLLLVSNQYGPRKIHVYGFGHGRSTGPKTITVAEATAMGARTAEEAAPPVEPEIEPEITEPDEKKIVPPPAVVKPVPEPAGNGPARVVQEDEADIERMEQPAAEDVRPDDEPAEQEDAPTGPALEPIPPVTDEPVRQPAVVPAPLPPRETKPETEAEVAVVTEPRPEPQSVVVAEPVPEPVAKPRPEPEPDVVSEPVRPRPADQPIALGAVIERATSPEALSPTAAREPVEPAGMAAERARRFLAAVKTRDRRTVRRMLEVDRALAVNATADGGTTALHMAAVLRDTKLLIMLLDAGADVNARTFVGSTPLHWAVMSDNVTSAKELIKAGAAVDTVDSEGLTPLQSAEQRGNTRMLKLIGAAVEHEER